MQRFVNWLRGAFQSGPAPRRPRAVRPQLEQLDDRLVPSVTSAITTTNYWVGTTHELYAIDQATGHLIEFTANPYWGQTRTDWGGWVTAVSASVDPSTGGAEVFALGGGGSLWRCDSYGQWHELSSNAYDSISATRDGQVYAAGNYFLGNRIQLFHADGSMTDLGNPNGSPTVVDAIAAGTDRYGNDEVFAAQGGLYVGNNSGSWQTIDTSREYGYLSATPSGGLFAADVEGNHVYHFTQHQIWIFSYWTADDITAGLPTTSGVASLSPGSAGNFSADTDASGQDELYVVAYGPDWGINLYRWDQGSWQQFDSNVSTVAAAGSGYFFDVNPYNPYGNAGEAWAFDPNGAGWIDLGGGVETGT
jgi:hypothetical protein